LALKLNKELFFEETNARSLRVSLLVASGLAKFGMVYLSG
jgi:hypothetical protein